MLHLIKTKPIVIKVAYLIENNAPTAFEGIGTRKFYHHTTPLINAIKELSDSNKTET